MDGENDRMYQCALRISGTHSKGDPVVAVMGIDVRVNYIRSMLHDVYPICEDSKHTYVDTQHPHTHGVPDL